jgi:phosphonate transport system substrate-binding protein
MRFAVPPSLGREAEARIEQLSHFLRDALGHGVEVSRPASYEQLAKELLSGRIDAAWAPPFVCARVEAMGVRVLVRGVRHDASTYRAALVCRKGHAVSLAALKGRAAVWADRDSVAGYLLPMAYVREQGFAPGQHFGEQTFAGSYLAALETVLAEKAFVTSVFASSARGHGPTRLGMSEIWPEQADSFDVVAYTPESPNDGVAAAMNAPPQVLADLERVLVAMADTERGRAVLHHTFRCQRFELAPRSGYRALYRVALASL